MCVPEAAGPTTARFLQDAAPCQENRLRVFSEDRLRVDSNFVHAVCRKASPSVRSRRKYLLYIYLKRLSGNWAGLEDAENCCPSST